MEKKEHHLTRAKRLREEALARGETVEDVVQEVEELKAKVEALESEPHYVLDARSNVVAYAKSKEEAESILVSFPNGKIQCLPKKK